MKIAIVGGGISGLYAAYRLAARNEVTVFESASTLGGHAHTVDVATEEGVYAIDTGFIVFNRLTYPYFCRLLDELGVSSQPTRMSFSVHCERTGLEYRGADWNGIFAQRRNVWNVRFWRMLFEMARFHRRALASLPDLNERETISEFAARERFSADFLQRYLLPMGSAVWSAPTALFREFPVRPVLEFFRQHGLLGMRGHPPWRVICGGSRVYVEALIRALRHVAVEMRLACRVMGVQRDRDDVTLFTSQGKFTFDWIVFACHADQALEILGSAAQPLEREILSAFPYQRNTAILHTDTRVLPCSRRAWACWNYHVPVVERECATVTYNMNMLQGLQAKQTFCVTLNDEERIDPAAILGRYTYHHPVFDPRRMEAQRRHEELLFANRTSFCGAYWGNGFHEDGVQSALRVSTAWDQR